MFQKVIGIVMLNLYPQTTKYSCSVWNLKNKRTAPKHLIGSETVLHLFSQIIPNLGFAPNLDLMLAHLVEYHPDSLVLV
jgi:hypothetical protein